MYIGNHGPIMMFSPPSEGAPGETGNPATQDSGGISVGTLGDTNSTGGLADAGSDDGSFALGSDFEGHTDDGMDVVELPPEQGDPAQQSRGGTETPPSGRQTQQPSGQQRPAAQGQPRAPVAQPQVQQPTAQQQPPAPAAPSQQQPASPARTVDPNSIRTVRDNLVANRPAIEAALSTGRFALTPEEKTAFETDAIAAIPKVLSRLFFEASTVSLNQIMQFVPTMIDERIGSHKVEQDAEGSFFTAYPGLRAHSAKVMEYANIWRRMNPDADQATAEREIGRGASAMLGVPLPRGNGQQQNGGAPPRPNGTGNRPFTPASGGVSVTRQNVDTNNDPWSGMGNNYD